MKTESENQVTGKVKAKTITVTVPTVLRYN
jgi:hypothetical protein